MADFNFPEYYKRMSNTELFDILDNPEDYQPSAIEAAKNELSNRELSEPEIDEAKAPLIAIHVQKEKQAEKNKILEGKLKAAGESIFNSVNPADSETQNTNKKILFIVIIYGGYFVLQISGQPATILKIIKEITHFPFQVSLFLLPYIITPVALVTFLKRKPTGWTLLASCVTYSAAGTIVMLYKIFTYESSGLPFFKHFYKQPGTVAYIFYLFILASILYGMCKQNIREIYKIDTPKMAGIIFIGAIVSLILLIGIY